MTTTPEQIEFYWRPGCGFCMALERNLTKIGVPLTRLNIWEDPDAAGFVRSAASGNETVPTVRVGDITLVNPRAGQVMESLAEQAPELVPDGYSPGSVSRLMSKITRTAS